MVAGDAQVIVLATRSRHKAREIHDILAPSFHGDIITLDDAGVAEDSAEDDLEVFDDFLANARAKADHFFAITGRPTIADDSGICVHALGGAPGVRSKRFAWAPGLDGAGLELANNERLLRELGNVPDAIRTAHYTCAAILRLGDGRRLAAIGTCAGTIVHEPRGSSGFGYDPLFMLQDDDRTFAQMSDAEKHLHSHRGRAFRALAGMIAPRL